MLGFFKKLFGAKPAEVTTEAPYKVEASAQEPVQVVSVSDATVPVTETAPAPKAKAPKAKKPQGARKPRAPRKPKQPK